MAFTRVSTTAFASTGIKTITTTGQPIEAEFDVYLFGGETGANRHICRGWTDGTRQSVVFEGEESGQRIIDGATNKLIWIQEWNGSAWADELVATFDSFNATSVKINVTVAGASAANYQVRYRTRD